ncbi:uncharacterized protein LOC124153777 [Ischnura elegans]|nr:uncharacterized protein LOC124153777 [Ischnura elegans]
MRMDCPRDCVNLRFRISQLHQTWKWLHQTITVHDFLVSLASSQKNNI